MRLHKLIFLISVSVIFFLYSCKTTETGQSKEKAMNEQTRQEVLQTEVDTNSIIGFSPEELREATLFAQEMGQLHCNMKQYGEKDMSDILNQKGLDRLKMDSIILQRKVDYLSDLVIMEYERTYLESIRKCE